MKDFEYAAAKTVDEAVGLLAAKGDRAKVLAGGTDIIVQLRETGREADLVVDVKRIPELTKYEYSPQSGLKLGASVPCYKIYEDAALQKAYTALCDSARIIGGWQIQSRASIGGNLCNSSPAADSIPSLIALDAKCHIAGPGGKRTVAAADFCTGPGKNVLQQGELLTTLEFAAPQKGEGSHYLRFIPRNEMDIAVVGCGAWVRLSADGKTIAAARISLGAVAAKPLFAAEASSFLTGKPATVESFTQAGELAKKIATPISDMRGPAEYRTHLVGVLVVRALTKAVERAGQQK